MKLTGMHVFITGGAGFIGSHVADSLVNSGAKVTVYDNFSSGKSQNLSAVKGKIRLIKGDISDAECLTKAMRGAKLVSHHAAQLEIIKAESDPFFDLRTNTLGTLNVLKAAKQNKVSQIINISSACVYGEPQYTPQDETHPTNPNWAYGVSKLAAEKYCRIFMESSGIPVVSLRYAIVYGPREWFRRVLTIFIKRLYEGKDLVVFFDGKYYRDYIYVKDAVDLHNRCILNPKTYGQILNVGTGQKTSIIQLAKTAKENVQGRKVKIIFENVAQGKESNLVKGKIRNPADLTGMCLDRAKAKRLTGWIPLVTLAEGIKEEIDWFGANPQNWGKIKYTM